MQDKAKNAGKVAIVLEGGSFRGELDVYKRQVIDVVKDASWDHVEQFTEWLRERRRARA